MNRKTVAELRENEPVESSFLVKSKNTATGRTGRLFINLVLMDSTGEIEAKIWDDAAEWDKAFSEGDLVKVRGKILNYQGRLQLNVAELRRCFSDEVNPDDFFPHSHQDLEKMFREFLSLINSIQNPYLKKLLQQIFLDPQISADFKIAPAAKSVHHVFRGGLLEHSLSIAKLTQKFVAHYRDFSQLQIDGDLLLAGAALHDLGKIKEISPEGNFSYTNEGRLIGHIVLGFELVSGEIKKIQDFPPELELTLKHILLSHHGFQEFGSPQEPMTLEAMILYYLDDLDSKIQSISSHLEKDKTNKDDWTPYHRSYERYFYKGKIS